MRTIKLKYVILSLLFVTSASFAQTKKLSKNYKTSQDVNVELDTRHTNIIIENWDRNEVQIEAYLEGETGDKEMAQKMLDSWKLETGTSNGKVKIKSGGNSSWKMDMGEIDLAMSQLQPALDELPDMLAPLMENLVGPILSNIAENPLPPGFAEDMKGMKFDYDAYKEDGDEYLEKWEANFEKKFGKEYEAKMEKWAEEVEKNSEVH